MEINKLKEFMEHIDLKEIENKVRSTWMHKKLMHKQMVSAVNQACVPDKQNRLAPWVKKVKNKVVKSPEITLEERRIKILKVVEKPFLITSKAEFLEKN